MRKIIREVIEFAVALKDGAVVVVFLLALVLRRPARQSGDDVKTFRPGRVRAKGEPAVAQRITDAEEFEYADSISEPYL